MFPYGPEGRYVVLMNEDQYHYYGNCARWLEGKEKAKKMWFKRAKRAQIERDRARAWARIWKAKAKNSRGIIETFSDEDFFDTLASAVIKSQKDHIEMFRTACRDLLQTLPGEPVEGSDAERAVNKVLVAISFKPFRRQHP